MNGGPSPMPSTPRDWAVAEEHARAAHYFSTYCIHGFHDECREDGCKFCKAACRCQCHRDHT